MLAAGLRALYILLVPHPCSDVCLLVNGEAVTVGGLPRLPAPSDLDGSCLASLGKHVGPTKMGTQACTFGNVGSSQVTTPHLVRVGRTPPDSTRAVGHSAAPLARRVRRYTDMRSCNAAHVTAAIGEDQRWQADATDSVRRPSLVVMTGAKRYSDTESSGNTSKALCCGGASCSPRYETQG